MYIKNSILAVIILEELIKKNKRNGFFGFNSYFTKEELASITELTLKNVDDLDYIECLSNLKCLKLIGVNPDSFEYKKGNNIKNFSFLKKLSLEELVIANDCNIHTLDLTNMENLKNLILINNSDLTTIVGLSKLKKLEKVVINSCPVKYIGDVKEYIDNTKDTAVNILSNLIFNSLFKETSINKYLSDCLMSNLSNIKFSEKIHFYDEIYLLTLDQMNECYKLAKEILKMIPLEGKDQYEQTYLVYRYIISHVSYDHDSLKFRDLNYEKVLKESSPKKEYILRRMAYINSSLCALKRHSVVCEGYVNMAIYLLDLLGIKANLIVCLNNDSLHSILKVRTYDSVFYCDPEKDSHNQEIKFFGLDLEAISALYKLPAQEYLEDRNYKNGKYFK